MKNKWIFLLLAMVLPFMVGIDGCQTTGANYYYDANGTYVEITDPPGQCVLYRVLGDTMAYKTGLFVVNYAALKAKFYTGAEAIAELDIIEKEVLRPGANVGSVINTLTIVAAKASKVGAPEVVLVTEGLAPFKSNMTPLDDCTRYKLISYLGSQRNLALAFSAGD